MASKILVVDDSTFVRNQIREILKIFPVEVIETEDGLAAIEALSQTKEIQLIICDINMPRMDGLEFLRQISANSPTKKPEIPVIMLTTENKMDRVLEGKKLGAVAWLIKPAATQDIRKLVESFCKLEPQ